MAINEKFYIEAELDDDEEFYQFEETEVDVNTINDIVMISQDYNHVRLSVTQARKLREILERIS